MDLKEVFKNDSLGRLVKKFFVYKLMSSNLFINYSLPAMNLLYKTIGTKPTNFLINKSVGSLFTSGETIQSLCEDIRAHEKSGVFGVANYVVEGLETMDEVYIQRVYDHMLESI